MKLAREALTLSDLSGGRVVLGVGLGDPNDRGAALNPLWDADRGRAAQMDERLDLLLGLLAGRVPVWVGRQQRGRGGRPAGGAGRCGVVPYKLTDTDRWSDFTGGEVADLVAAIAAHRSEAGVTASVDVAVGGRRRLPSDGGRARRGRRGRARRARPGGSSSCARRRMTTCSRRCVAARFVPRSNSRDRADAGASQAVTRNVTGWPGFRPRAAAPTTAPGRAARSGRPAPPRGAPPAARLA